MTTEPKPQDTPGLLRAIGDEIVDSQGRRFILGLRGMKPEMVAAFVSHLAACWNGCERAGINPEALPELVAVVDDVANDLDALLADIEYDANTLKGTSSYGCRAHEHCTTISRDKLRAALAKAKIEPKGAPDG
jgi:hypothetical protein